MSFAITGRKKIAVTHVGVSMDMSLGRRANRLDTSKADRVMAKKSSRSEPGF